MQIEVGVGENLTIKTVRGVVVLNWICGSKNLVVTTFFDDKETKSSVKMVDAEAGETRYAAEVRLSALEREL